MEKKNGIKKDQNKNLEEVEILEIEIDEFSYEGPEDRSEKTESDKNLD